MKIAIEEISTIARSIFTATDNAASGRTTYLRALVGATQDELGKRGRESGEQLAAITVIHDQFYEIVMQAAEAHVPKGHKHRGVELHRRANFARTAVSALRGHVRAGGDVMALSQVKVTKAALKVREGPTRAPSARRLKSKAESQSKALLATLMGLADADKGAAVDEIQLVLDQLSSQLIGLGVVATKDAAQSSAEHRPLRIGKTLFLPTETQVLRQRAQPS